MVRGRPLLPPPRQEVQGWVGESPAGGERLGEGFSSLTDPSPPAILQPSTHLSVRSSACLSVHPPLTHRLSVYPPPPLTLRPRPARPPSVLQPFILHSCVPCRPASPHLSPAITPTIRWGCIEGLCAVQRAGSRGPRCRPEDRQPPACGKLAEKPLSGGERAQRKRTHWVRWWRAVGMRVQLWPSSWRL